MASGHVDGASLNQTQLVFKAVRASRDRNVRSGVFITATCAPDTTMWPAGNRMQGIKCPFLGRGWIGLRTMKTCAKCAHLLRRSHFSVGAGSHWPRWAFFEPQFA